MPVTNQWDKNCPTYIGGAVPDEFDKMKYNFAWMQRVMMAIGFIPVNGATRTPTYHPTTGSLTRITFGGTITGQIDYNYNVSTGDLSSEVWTIDGKTMTITYNIDGTGTWQGDSVGIV